MVEPLVAQQTLTAFVKAAGVMISRALISFHKSSITFRPASSASFSRAGSVAQSAEFPGSERPKASAAMHMLFAVPMRQHAPGPGQT